MINTAKVALQIREKIIHNSHPLVLEFAPVACSLLLSVGLYWYSIRQINLLNITDVGLISVLPGSIYVSLLLLCTGFALTLKQKTLREPVLLLHVFLLIVMLYGTTLSIEQAPRFNVTWRHAGLVDYIQRNAAIMSSPDPYLNWPGFFILSAFISEVGGLKSILDLVPYAPILNNLLYLGALMLIFRSSTRNQRLRWVAIWVFYIANWIAQDYFSPQGLDYFLYLMIIGIVLRWYQAYPGKSFLTALARPRILSFLSGRAFSDGQPVLTAPSPTLALSICLVVLVAFSVSSHQLTPFALLAAITALTLFRFNSFRSLPWIIAGLIAAWMIFIAAPFMKANLGSILQDMGHLEQAFHEGVTDRLDGSAGHLLVVRFRLMFTLGIWGLALCGMFLRFRDGFKDPMSSTVLPDARLLLLALAPFSLIALQFYGGEMILRVYLFTLPFMVFFVASLLFPEHEITISGKKTAAAVLVSMVMIAGFFLARYGNERMDQFTAKEVDAVQYFYAHAPAGSLLAAPSPHYPAKFLGYEQYKLKFLPDQVLQSDIKSIVSIMSSNKYPDAYFIITRSQKSYFYMFYGDPINSWDRFQLALLHSGHFVSVYSNPDATIYKYTEGVKK